MRALIHNPHIARISTLPHGDDRVFHVVRLADNEGGELSLFIEPDWSDWDRLVTAIENYRKDQA